MPVFLYECLAAIISGSVLQLISPPTYWHFLHWVSYTPLFFALTQNSIKKNFFLGWLCGFFGVFFLFSWLIDTLSLFAHWPVFFAWLVYFIFCAAFALPYAFLSALFEPLRRTYPKSWIYLFATAWVAVEFLTPSLFPYYQGLSQYRVPVLWQTVSVLGVSGLSFLVILSNAFLADIGLRLKSKQKIATVANVLVPLIFLIVILFGFWRVGDVEREIAKAPALRVGLMQVKESMQTRMEHSLHWNMNLFVQQARRINHLPQDLMVWPEGVLLRKTSDLTVNKQISEITNGEFAFLSGARTKIRQETEETAIYHNSAVLFGKDGILSGVYDKMILLPFGEYLPHWLAFLNPVWGGQHVMEAGKVATVLQLGNVKITTPICYEAILKNQMLQLATGDVLINLTDDGWFGNTAAAHQHAMLAATSATELGRPLVRAAANGVNLVVAPDGRMLYETKPFEDIADVVKVPIVVRQTFYLAGGRYFPALCSFVTGIVLLRFLTLILRKISK